MTESSSKTVAIGWVLSFLGLALWTYGYLVAGHPPLVDWRANTPWWIADYLPNIETEIGFGLMIASMVPMYWPCHR